jgi:hypothetical protein
MNTAQERRRSVYTVHLYREFSSECHINPHHADKEAAQQLAEIQELVAVSVRNLGYADSLQQMLLAEWNFRYWSLESVEVDGNCLAFVPPPLPQRYDQPPGPGWEWRGKDDRPGSPEGGWVKEGEGSLHWDPEGHSPLGPHWDWTDPSKNIWRREPDSPIWWPDQKNKPNRPQPDFPEGAKPPSEPTFVSPVVVMPGTAPGSGRPPQSPSGSGSSWGWPSWLTPRWALPTIMIIVTPPSFKMPEMGGWKPPGDNA